MHQLARCSTPISSALYQLAVCAAHFVEERGIDIFRVACERDFEGIIAKQKDTPYVESVRWVKIKNPGYSQAAKWQEELQRRRAR